MEGGRGAPNCVYWHIKHDYLNISKRNPKLDIHNIEHMFGITNYVRPGRNGIILPNQHNYYNSD